MIFISITFVSAFSGRHQRAVRADRQGTYPILVRVDRVYTVAGPGFPDTQRTVTGARQQMLTARDKGDRGHVVVVMGQHE